jgi:MFS family permease
MQSMLPSLVPPAMLARATAAAAVSGQSAVIVGPTLGGLLYVAGPDVVYGVAAAFYLLSIMMIARIRFIRAAQPRLPASIKTLFAGVKFIRERRDVLGVISLDLFAVLLSGATALLPIFAKDILHTGPWGLGLLRGAPSVGALLVGVWLSRNKLEKNVGMIMFGSVAGFGVATLIFALSNQLWLSLLALAALGGFDMVSMVIRGALVQLDTPDEMRGRVNAVNSIFINTSNQLGEFESGMLAALMGAVPAAVLGGVGTLVVVGIWMTLFPHLRRRQKLESDPDAHHR